MAKIDIFLDFDEVLKGTVIEDHSFRSIVYESSVNRLNRFIGMLKDAGHEINIVPVTTHRESKSLEELRTLFEETGLTKNLPFLYYPDGSRAEVVTQRLALGETDAYVIFDDDKSAYPETQENLVVVVSRRFHSIPDEYRGIVMGNITQARKFVRDQLAGPTRGKAVIQEPKTDPSQTP